MGPYALLLFVVVAVQAVAQSQDCSADPLAGAFEFSEFCRPLRNRDGVRFGQVCADTKLNDKQLDPGALFLPSCIRAKFRADDGYELNLIRAGAHFDEPPTGQDRFTSRRNIDGWKTKNEVTDSIRWARVLICPEELQGQTDCCGQGVRLVASAVVSRIGSSDEQIRVFLGAEDDDDMCTTRESDNTTACDVMIACPPCETGDCRGPGGVCEDALAFECPIGEEPFIREDGFCDCSQPTATSSPAPSNGPVKLTCSTRNVFVAKFVADGMLRLSVYGVSLGACNSYFDLVNSGGGPCNQPIDLGVFFPSCFHLTPEPNGCPSCSEIGFLNQTCGGDDGLESIISTAVLWFCHEEGGNPDEILLITCASEYPDGQNDCRFEDGADCNCPATIPAPETLPPTNS